MGVTSAVGLTTMPSVEPLSTTDELNPTTLLCLPVEIRLQIYAELFGTGKIVLDGGDHQKTSCIVSSTATPITTAESRSSQLLRTCKTILYEARPVLYANTVFHVIRHTFSGSLPSTFTDNHPSAKHISDVIWQVECDILKRWYEDDLQFQEAADWASLKTLEIRCRVEAWRGSYCGVVDERADFAAGRDQVLKYGTRLLEGMAASDVKTFHRLVEDRRFHGKGEMRIRLTSSRGLLCSEVSRLEHKACGSLTDRMQEVVVEDLQSWSG
jgi:hypothetical protein